MRFFKKLLGKKDFSDIPRHERKKFLSNDFVERMIRIEQNVSRSFDKDLSYKETEHYKSLSKEEKKSFKEYLKNKSKKKIFSVFIVLLSLFLLFSFSMINFGITGNVVKDSIGEELFGDFFVILIAFVLIVVLCVFISKFRLLKRNKFFNRHTDVLYGMFAKKSLINH